MTTNRQALETAQTFFPGGVNSPVRAFKAVGGHPPFIRSGKGAHLTDIEGKSYIDFVGSWGPLILGHAWEPAVTAVSEAARDGMSFGAPTLREIELARVVKRAFPSMPLMRFVSSGTEATMSAIRVARGFTGRPRLVKIDGCYHGHADSLLVSAGSGVATLGIPGCPGIPAGTAADTLVIPFNDIPALEELFRKNPKEIAAVILEPVCGNIGVVLPREGYLESVLAIAHHHGALVIFDEVMTGFRAGFGGVQTLKRLTPDLTCLGKIVGGGLPLAIYGGREDIMRQVAPDGPVYQAGTLSGNPLAVSAGLAVLTYLESHPESYTRLFTRTESLCQGLSERFRQAGRPGIINRHGSMFTAFFTNTPVEDYSTAKTSDTELFRSWFGGLLAHGVYIAPSQFEAGFVSMAHTQEDIDVTLAAVDQVLPTLGRPSCFP
jgi:glutamate-1-semialdehyde 2,1-aminomutase